MGIGTKLRILAGTASLLALALGAGSWTGAHGVPAGSSNGARAALLESVGKQRPERADTGPWEQAGRQRDPGTVRALAAASAPGKPPDFLNAIGIPEAWNALAGSAVNVTGTIAVVDTGADLLHPQLAPYLTGGVNLLNARKPPQDDNGHGTAVAGVLAEIADAAKAASGGAAWSMKIMPIKALDSNGEGDEKNLTAGIRYAVEHGADIVVLSLGLRRDTSEMRSVVAEAESKGVLLVAASGNDGAEFGTKAAVQYPAAYPSVLAVAGAEGNGAQSRSTAGPEVDVAAPWRVTTLKLGGGTTTMEGSSMSAPQVAGVAALLRARHPDWTPAQLREMLRRTAKDIAAKGWDRNTGYGLVRADAAVASERTADWREPDENRLEAAAFPLGAELPAVWSGASDVDGYAIDVPYDGELTVSWQIDDPAYSVSGAKPALQLYPMANSREIARTRSTASSAVWKVTRGKYYLKTAKGQWGENAHASGYRLVSSFAMAPDPMEPNPNALNAYTLPPRSQKWTGSFSSQGDEDWVVVALPQPGKLSIRVDTDTTRIDPAIFVQRAGESGKETDAYGDGKSEEVTLPNAAAGKYYIRIRNAVSSNPEPVIGTYTAQLEYITSYADPQEPNDTSLTATPLDAAKGDSRSGTVDPAGDVDWYRFSVGERKRIRIELSGLPASVRATVRLYDKQLTPLHAWSSDSGGEAIDAALEAAPGLYYVAVTADAPFRSSYYKLSLMEEEPSSGYSDIAGHWAFGAIRAVTEAGWMAGYEDGAFRPDRALTRAEAIAIAVRAFRPGGGPATGSRFADVTPGMWAYGPIVQADAARWLSQYAGSLLEPNRQMTRGEAATLFAKAKGLTLSPNPVSPFADVPSSHPSAAALEALARKGWIGGFADGTFRPAEPISRAQWAAMLAQLL